MHEFRSVVECDAIQLAVETEVQQQQRFALS